MVLWNLGCKTCGGTIPGCIECAMLCQLEATLKNAERWNVPVVHPSQLDPEAEATRRRASFRVIRGGKA